MDTDVSQSEVVAFLADPATHGLAGGVAHVRTHISDVFLAGERAYKIKRARRYAFVDFSALESRHSACEAEVALNRRTAPELYLGVTAVRRRSDGLLSLDRLGQQGTGKAIEWAVVMQRFDEDRTLDRLATRGALDAALIDGVVDQVAELHAEAAVGGAPYGGASGLRAVIEENAADMTALGQILPSVQVEKLTSACHAALTRHAGLLDARRDAGLVRRCHGDLHLANAVLWRGRPVLFDCIEFSDRIATIDIAYDIAFLLMDLDVRGLRSLASRAFGRYFGRMGGTAVLAALPLMLSLRATVRAKVTAMAAGGDIAPAKQEDLARHSRELLDAATRFLAPPPPPRLIAVGGLSGTGKTLLAAMLAPDFAPAPGALHLRSDVIRKRLAGMAPEERLPPESYTPESHRAVYRTMQEDTAHALAGGYSVVLDAVFAKPEERHAAESLARNGGASFHGLWLEAPAETLAGRVSSRTRDASDATAAVVRQQAGYDVGAVSWTRIDAGTPPDCVLAAARRALG